MSTAGKHHLHMEVTLVDSVVVEVKCVLYLYMIYDTHTCCQTSQGEIQFSRFNSSDILQAKYVRN